MRKISPGRLSNQMLHTFTVTNMVVKTNNTVPQAKCKTEKQKTSLLSYSNNTRLCMCHVLWKMATLIILCFSVEVTFGHMRLCENSGPCNHC